MDWQKSVIQKDIIYYFKYENCQAYLQQVTNSDNSVQINIKFTFTAYIYTYVCMYIYIYIYIYIYMNFVCFVYLFIPTLSQHIHMMAKLV